MMTLNPFVENNKARINRFLNDLCEVGDFYESLEVSGYRRSCLPSNFSPHMMNERESPRY